MVLITPYAEKRKAAIREERDKKVKKITDEIRHRRYLISHGTYEYLGKNNREEIIVLNELATKIELDAGKKIRGIDVAKHRIQDKKAKKHRWSF